MVFKKELWLEQIDKEIQEGLHTERDKNDALEIWVNDLDGKEIDKNNIEHQGLIIFCKDEEIEGDLNYALQYK